MSDSAASFFSFSAIVKSFAPHCVGCGYTVDEVEYYVEFASKLKDLWKRKQWCDDRGHHDSPACAPE